jgi:phosphopantothenoylcysteine synthetase/decarboxylase
MKRFLVTAGSTREAIDQVRDWGNIFTGNTGRAIAEALAPRGVVDLLTSNDQHAEDLARLGSGILVTRFRSHADLRRLLESHMQRDRYDAVFMTAAIADYVPQRVFSVVGRQPLVDGREHWVVQDVQAGKVKSDYPSIAVLGARTEKLVDLFRSRWAFRGLLVKFKLEVGISEDRLIEVAESSRRASCADYIVANTLEMVSGVAAGAWLLGETVRERIPRGELPRRLTALV